MLTFLLVRALLRKVTVLWGVDGRVVLFVEVTSRGIGKVDQERIFERFVRAVDGSGVGTGIDSPIVRPSADVELGELDWWSVTSNE
ncbi:hypothetical protein ACFFQW_03370 [Umezawaea endophytica]|uniref:ATP-binding protein n=1 Tax=Umezawaea endophytica TaxID=1654476 RepID=A0A9X2VME2_9PSEU|nr:ATP-binding protein [Umezawaea endophytica]MCS7479186.1 ATP-binding protein [Umezawaea endophytica]